MKKHKEGKLTAKADIQQFTHHIYQDIKALELIIENDKFEKGITRIGAEQEIALIDSSFRPVNTAQDILGVLRNDHKITNELPLFNLEVNLSPLELTGNCLSAMEDELKTELRKIYDAAKKFKSKPVLVGILPTIRQSDLTMDNMTPNPRYFALNKVLTEMRGSEYDFRIQGTDELITKLDSIMFECCNTSFQVHYQVSADDFISAYNWAQVVAAPALAVATNSPLLLGKRLWRETRIAIFQQSTDTRRNLGFLREQEARVYFGTDWARNSVTDIFKEDVARHPVLIASDIQRDSVDMVRNDEVPVLKALRLHNGTVYKWNRPCYGIHNGIPHLRIENRVLPSGPSVIDEIANAAFWIGMMHGMPDEYRNISEKFEFDQARTNFYKVAQMGMGTAFRWIDGKTYNAQDLVLREMLPIAREGLKKARVDADDISTYLDIIEERTTTGNTGSQWILDSFNTLKREGTQDEAVVALTAGMVRRQRKNIPVHRWDAADIDEAGSWVNRYWRIDQIMSVNLYTAREDDLIDRIPNLMSWKDISYVPVENEDNQIIGLVTYSELISYYATHTTEEHALTTVRDIMITDPVCIDAETLTIEAINIMRRRKIGCLPIIRGNNVLVGIVTKEDFVNVADHFLQEYWSEKKSEE
jgi:CBS domain-containing protein